MSAAASDPARLAEWAEQLERDPGSDAFLPLARACASNGRHAAALRLCIQGLTHDPEHVEAHFLLGQLYLHAGELDKAFDEWDITLRLDPAHAGARQEIARLRDASPAPPAPPPPVALAAPPVPAVPAGIPPAERAPGMGAALQRFVEAVRPHALLLVSSSGRLLAQHGFGPDDAADAAGIATLAAGIHAASTALAGLLRQPRFDHLYHQGEARHFFIGSLAAGSDAPVLVAITGDASRLGLLRIGFRALSREVGALPPGSLPNHAARAETFEQDLDASRAALFGRADAADAHGAAASLVPSPS